MQQGTFSFRRDALSGDLFVAGTTCRASFEHQQQKVANVNALLAGVWTGSYIEESGTWYFSTFTQVDMPSEAIWYAFQGQKLGDAMSLNVVQAWRRFSEYPAGPKPHILQLYEQQNWFIKREFAAAVKNAFARFGASIFNWNEDEFTQYLKMSPFELACTTLPCNTLTPPAFILSDVHERKAAMFLQDNIVGHAVKNTHMTLFPNEVALLKPHVVVYNDFVMSTFDSCVMKHLLDLLPCTACRPEQIEAETLETYLQKLCETDKAHQLVVVVDTANPIRATAVAKRLGFFCTKSLANIGASVQLPLIILRNRYLPLTGRGPMYAMSSDFEDIEWPFFASAHRAVAQSASTFFQFATSRNNAKQTLIELVELNLLPVRRGSYVPLSFHEHLELDTPRFIQGAHVKNKAGEVSIIKKVHKKSNGEITRLVLDNDITCTKDDITLISQVTSRSIFRRRDARGARYGTVVAFFPYLENEALVYDKVQHEDVCRVLQLVYSGLASKVIFVAKSWKILGNVLRHERHTRPYTPPPGTTYDTPLSRLQLDDI